MRRLAPLLAALAVWTVAAAPAAAATTPAVSTGQAARATLQLIPQTFAPADLTHNASVAARVRVLALTTAAGLRAEQSLGAASAATARLSRLLAATEVRLQPWPLPQTVRADSADAERALEAAGAVAARIDRPYGPIRSLLAAAAEASGTAKKRWPIWTPPEPTPCSSLAWPPACCGPAIPRLASRPRPRSGRW